MYSLFFFVIIISLSRQIVLEIPHWIQIGRSGLGAAFVRGELYAVGGRTIINGRRVQDTDMMTKYSHSTGWV